MVFMSGCVSLGATAIMLAVIYFMVRAFTAAGKSGNGAPSSWGPAAAGGTKSWGTDPQTGRQITVQVKGDSTWKWAAIQVPMARSMPSGLVIGVRPTPRLALSHGERGDRAFYALVDAMGKNPRSIESWATQENQNAVLDAYWKLQHGFQVRGTTISANVPVSGEGDPQIKQAVYILAELGQRLTAATTAPAPAPGRDDELDTYSPGHLGTDSGAPAPPGHGDQHDELVRTNGQADRATKPGVSDEPSQVSGASAGLGTAALAFPGSKPTPAAGDRKDHSPSEASLSPFAAGSGTAGQSPSPFAAGSAAPGQSPSPFSAGSGAPAHSPSPFASGSGAPAHSPSPFASGSGTSGQSPSPFASGTLSPGTAPALAASDAAQPKEAFGKEGTREAAADPGDGEDVSAILATVTRAGSSDAQEKLVAARWTGRVVTGEGKASFSSQIFGRDTELEVTGGTKVTLEVPVEGGGVLAPKVVLHLVEPPEPGRLGFGKVVRFQGEVKGYRGLSRNLLLVNGRIL